MEFDKIRETIAGVPYVMEDMAYDLYYFVLDKKPERVLELGFGHGASSCYIAAALEEIGRGKLTAVDLVSAATWQHPSIEELLERTGLGDMVEVKRENTSYTWFLKKMIVDQSSATCCTPVYDLCFLDGAKNWTIDGAAFFLIDKLLKPGGWVVFDDLQWTYKSKLAEGKKKTDGVSMLEMGDDELIQPHIELIFQYLVMQHPSYSNFLVKDNWWGWAQKDPKGSKELKIELSSAYKERLRRWEEKNQTKHRHPFQPFEN